MAENNAVFFRKTSDIEREIAVVQGNSVASMRILRDNYQRQLAVLMSELEVLKQNSTAVKHLLYNNYDLQQIEEKYQAGRSMTIEPIQVLDGQPTEGFYGSHPSITYDLNQMQRRSLGTLTLKKEAARIDEEISKKQELIRNYQKKLKELNAKIEANNRKKEGITSEELIKDKIARSVQAQLEYLYQLHKQFLADTTDPVTNTRGWPENQNLKVRELMAKLQLFRAHAMQFPKLVKGPNDYGATLNLNDPGDPINGKILYGEMVVALGTSKNFNVEQDVKKYIDSVKATVQDPHLSKGINRTPEAQLPSEKSLSEKLRSYPVAMVDFFGAYYISSWKLPNFYESVSKWWKGWVKKSFVGLPPCKKPALTETDIKQAEIDAKNLEENVAGIKKFAETREKVRKATKKELRLLQR